MNVLFVIDPLESLEADIDSSVGLMAAVESLGAVVWVCSPEHLSAVGGRVHAQVRRIELRPRAPRGDHRWRIDQTWFDEAERRTVDVAAAMDTVLMRLDPPVDARYLHTTYLLDLVERAGTAVVNRPEGIRAAHEKLLALWFPDLGPPTLVSTEPAEILDFLSGHGTVVVKPMDGFAGTDVWLLRRDDPNAVSLVDSATGRGSRHVIAQQYLPAVTAGNKRLFVLDGSIIGTVSRRPSAADFRIGPPVEACPADAADQRIVDVLAPELARLGIVLAGLDVIDGRLIEVNLTCPGGMHKTDALLGTDLSGTIVRRLLSTTLRPSEERLLPCPT